MSSDILNIFLELEGDEDPIREDYVKAPYGWPGGKDLSKKHILPLMPYRQSWIEHCGGTGVLSLNRTPSRLNVFNDRDAGVTAFYRCIRDRKMLQELVNKLELMVHSREEFIYNRKTWQECTDPIERAARWYYVVRFSFNQQKRNFGRAKSGKYKNPLVGMISASLKLFSTIHARMQHFTIENLDLKQSLSDYDNPGAVHYIDPTYISSDETGVCKGIYEHEMTLQDHEWMIRYIHERGQGFFAVSGYANSIYDNRNWKWDRRITWEVPMKAQAQAFTANNHKEGKNSGRGMVTEVLWIKDKS